MSRWSQRMAAAQRLQPSGAANANNANRRSNRDGTAAIGTNGAIGTGARNAGNAANGNPRQATSRATSECAPCPADIAERSAVVMEAAGLDRGGADLAALTEVNPPSWIALAERHREAITRALDELPPPCNHSGAELLKMTKSFVASAWFDRAIALGWPLNELFGVSLHHSQDRIGEHGLVASLALSVLPGGKLVKIEDAHAVIRCRTGSELTYHRFMPAMDAAVPWWECPWLFGP